MEEVQEEARAVFPRGRGFHAEMFGGDEGVRDPVARGEDHDVERFAPPIGEADVIAFEGGDVGRRRERSGGDALIEIAIDDRMAREECVIRAPQAVPPGQADRAVDGTQAQRSAQPERRVHLEEPLAAHVGGPSEEKPGHDVVAAAGREHCAARMP